MPKLKLDRRTLASLLQNNQQAIAAFERMFGDVDGVLPSTIEEANALAGQALAVAQGAVLALSMLTEALERLEAAPAALPHEEPDDMAPRAHLGTIASQNADAVEITGGTAALTELTVARAITSTLDVGPPLIVASAERVANLYVDRAGLADKLGAPTTFPAAATDLPTAITLVNALRIAGIAKGL